MRHWTGLLSGAATFAGVFAGMPGAEAQSLFQKLFGFGNAPQAVPAPVPQSTAAPRPRQIIPSGRLRSFYGMRQMQRRATPERDDDIGPPDSGGLYKTLCVRTCDGFYFPIRHNARHKNFASDVRSCQNACGPDAHLYYYALSGPEGPDAMVDLAGRKYAELPHALAYRKKMISGCTCKPMPWSAQEAARHKSYAEQEPAVAANDDTPAPVDSAAVNATDTNGSADVARPTIAEAVEAVVASAPQASTAVVASGLQNPRLANARSLKPRRQRAYAERAHFKPSASFALPSLFGGGKPKYVWPGDPR